MINILILIAGFALLYLGGELTLKGANSFAKRMGVRPIIIGLTIVALGTTAPELTVSFIAALGRESGLAFGNALGSCITNIGLGLGISAVISAIGVEEETIKKELPTLIIGTIILFAMSIDRHIGQIEGFILLVSFCCFIYYNVWSSAKDSKRDNYVPKDSVSRGLGARDFAIIVVGLIGLVAGAKLVVKEAILLAEKFNISKIIIGLTIVALGTSLPEIWLALTSAFKKDQQVSLGNVIGANIFNTLLIIGLVAVVCPINLDVKSLYIDFPFLLLLSALLYPLMKSGLKLSRVEGIFLLFGYVGFIILRIASGIG